MLPRSFPFKSSYLLWSLHFRVSRGIVLAVVFSLTHIILFHCSSAGDILPLHPSTTSFPRALPMTPVDIPLYENVGLFFLENNVSNLDGTLGLILFCTYVLR